MKRIPFRLPALAAGLALLAACNPDNEIIIGGDPPGEPRNLAAEYRWVFEGFTNGGQPVGYPVVELTWDVPTDWRDEPFRVYGKRSGGSSFFLVGTVTSCTDDGCVYRDRNVQSGQSYEYYVATVDEDTGEETTSEFREEVSTAPFDPPAAPDADSVTALDGAAYVRWTDDANGDYAARYLVLLTRLGANTYLYQLGETDGTGFLDERAENGSVHGYRVAAVSEDGQVSALSAEITGVPRPDVTAELVYAHADDATRSGFRFAGSEDQDPIVGGASASADWRLESDGAGWRIVPLNGAQVAAFPGRTTALVCGPGADASCRAATRAPSTGFTTSPISISPEFSYVFRVQDTDGAHYGVIRVTLLGSDSSGRDLMIFDWAYQLRPNEPRLNVVSN
ncbi:MAG TPA: hypothetical protein VHG91_18500 [Longimicrobium sp.]|nr:hypothetical protein [Longimicrobium sp.]